jgi:hypothetical protein
MRGDASAFLRYWLLRYLDQNLLAFVEQIRNCRLLSLAITPWKVALALAGWRPAIT